MAKKKHIIEVGEIDMIDIHIKTLREVRRENMCKDKRFLSRVIDDKRKNNPKHKKKFLEDEND